MAQSKRFGLQALERNDKIMSIILMFWQEILFGLLVLAVMGGTCYKLYSFPEVYKITREEWERGRGPRGLY